MADSDIASATYTIQNAAPTLSPSGWSCSQPQKASLMLETSLRSVLSALDGLSATPSERK
jgi:hypothetical protein